MISHGISDSPVKGGAEEAASVAGVTGVGATGAGAIGVGATGAGAVVAQGDVEEVERGRLNHMLRATVFLSTTCDGASVFINIIHCFYGGKVD